MTAFGTTDSLTEEASEGFPYVVSVTIEGVSRLLFHRWQDGEVEEKGNAPKGSKRKKTDNVESYVWRDGEGYVSLPGIYLVGSLVDKKNGAAKYRQDPRSPRKSALDLYRGAISAVTDLAPIIPTGRDTPTDSWDFLDSRRALVNQSAITRVRPGFLAGWRATVDLQCQAPEYISPPELLEMLSLAGRLVGVGDFRPSHGRFQVVKFDRVL